MTCAFVRGISQGRHDAQERPQHREHILPGRGQVMDIAREHVRNPHRHAVRVEQGLDIPAEIMLLSRVPQVDDGALAADGFLPAPVRAHDLAVQDHVRRSPGHSAFQRLLQSGRPRGQHDGHLVQEGY